MELDFFKYQGAGNDFILFDDRAGNISPLLGQQRIAHLCHRRFGVGADGLMHLRTRPGYDFEMVYFNADGAPSSMCGNGGRCIVRFARDLGIEREKYSFLAVDGPHEASIQPNGHISLGMSDVAKIDKLEHEAMVLDTGSPHYLTFVDDLSGIEVVTAGRSIRNSPTFRAQGINVNFVVDHGDALEIATYERGVEDETLACGTGVTAAAIGAILRRGAENRGAFHVPVRARGGNLSVSGRSDAQGRFTDLRLIGPAEFVFKGKITIK